MSWFVRHRLIVLALAVLGFVGVLSIGFTWYTYDPLAGLTTTTVSRGTVESVVSVSGITKARNAAELAFPSLGIVSAVYVREGDHVAAGTILATLGAAELIASRESALADLQVARADRNELVNGDTTAARAVNSTKVAIAAAELERTTNTQAVLVENARRALQSSDLGAESTNLNEDAPAPVISGTYQCKNDGQYTLSVFGSDTPSGYSMRIEGLESGTYPVSTERAVPFGTCGLYALFSASARYTNSHWIVRIPNTAASSYVSNKNAVLAAENTARVSIEAAKQALTLAEQEQRAANDTPRSEALDRANARVSKAAALVAQIEAKLADQSIIAPFSGTVTNADIVVGETATTKPVFTVLATDDIELKARIPEIDITSIQEGQEVRVIFDAENTTTLTGTVQYISPEPIQIDGVGYFEITVLLHDTPSWLRGGLNADIDIVTMTTPDTLRVPKRYVYRVNDQAFVRTVTDGRLATTTITTGNEGTDGWVAVRGMSEGTIIVAP